MPLRRMLSPAEGSALAVASVFIAAALAPLLTDRLPRLARALFPAYALGLAFYFFLQDPAVGGASEPYVAFTWIESLGFRASFALDPLARLFSMVICFTGSAVLLHSFGYFHGDRSLGRFISVILLFMASMLGLVLSENLISLFVFWELTSVASYLLIGFDNNDKESRKAALQALLVTSAGGLFLLAGLLVLGLQVDPLGTGRFEIAEWIRHSEALRESSVYPVAAVLVLIAAFTKSAQFPFHFWLPNAMKAPTPASAYLHAATMVKAGVFLVLRFEPVFGGNPAWNASMMVVGAATLGLGAFNSLRQLRLKLILAHSTVFTLGLLVFLVGLGARQAALIYLLAHALYKAALFLVVGNIAHQTGLHLRDEPRGLRREMPLTAAAAVLASISMAGLPPLVGFVAKEQVFSAVHGTSWIHWGAFPLAAVFSAIVACSLMIGGGPFFAAPITKGKRARAKLAEGEVLLALPPLMLGLASLAFGLLPAVRIKVLGFNEPPIAEAAMWLSAVSIILGVVVFHFRTAVLSAFSLGAIGPEIVYEKILHGTFTLAGAQTRVFQNGRIHQYLWVIFAFVVIAGGAAVLEFLWSMAAGGTWASAVNRFFHVAQMTDVRFHEWAVLALIVTGTAVAIHTTELIAAIVGLGIVGYGIALLYVLFGAPDLAMTQFMVETLTVVLLTLVMTRLPGFRKRDPGLRPANIVNGVLAASAGALTTLAMLSALDAGVVSEAPAYFEENAVSAARGRNIVNVILVDFRALDTLGEIMVLALAGAGVFSLVRLARDRKNREAQ